MQLGAKKGLGGASLLQAMAQEGEIADLGAPPPGAAAGAAGAAAAAAQSNAPVQLLLEEKLTLSVQRDGGLQSMEVSGGLQLLITDPSCDKVYVQLGLGSNPGYQFKTRPDTESRKEVIPQQ